MAEFQYTALTRDSRPVSGVIGARTEAQAIAQLAAEGTFVTDIAAAAESAAGSASAAAARDLRRSERRIPPRTRAAMLRQFSVGLEAGLPLLGTIHVVEEQAEHAAVRSLCHDLAERVQSGAALSDAMSQHPRCFSQLHVSMARVGETAGVLDQVMASLADLSERDLAIREKLKSASTYPAIVLGLAAVSVLVILTWILPRILETVVDSVAVLPWPTRALLAVSETLRSPVGAVAVLAAIAAAWALWRWQQTPHGRAVRDHALLRLPVLGPAVRRIAAARFARTLGTLTGSGITIVEAMHVTRGTLGNEALAQQIDQVTVGISEGRSIAERLRETGEFPPLLVQIIAMGERTGKLDELLLHAADSLDRESAAALDRAMQVVPVAFILALALIVAFILASVLLPIMNMDLAMGA